MGSSADRLAVREGIRERGWRFRDERLCSASIWVRRSIAFLIQIVAAHRAEFFYRFHGSDHTTSPAPPCIGPGSRPLAGTDVAVGHRAVPLDDIAVVLQAVSEDVGERSHGTPITSRGGCPVSPILPQSKSDRLLVLTFPFLLPSLDMVFYVLGDCLRCSVADGVRARFARVHYLQTAFACLNEFS